MKTLFRMAVIATLIGLSGCKVLQAGDTIEQKSYALYGSFVVFEEQAAKLVQEPEVPESIKEVLRDADSEAKPLADALLDAAGEVVLIKQALAEGKTTEEKVNIAIQNLSTRYYSAKPKIDRLRSLVTKEAE